MRALVRRRWSARGAALLLALPAGAASAEPRPGTDPAADPAPRRFGVALDVGLPGGMGASMVLRALPFLRIGLGATVGGAGNLSGAGIRGSLDVVPFRATVSPTLDLEAGRTYDADASGLAERALGLRPADAAAFRHVGYDYVAGQVGLEIGAPDRWAAFLRAGLGYVSSSTPALATAVQRANPGFVVVGTDPSIRMVLPSAKLGLVAFF